MSAPVEAAAATPARGEPVDLTVVVPVLDEREALEGLYAEIEAACAGLGRSWEAVFVDDGSTDGSGELLERLALEHPPVRLVQLRRNFGKSAALRAGFEHSRGAVVVTLDGDGQDDPAELPGLLAKLDEGYDLVSGWKRERQDPRSKRWPSKVYNRVTARLSGLPLHDFNSGLKAYRGDRARALELYGELHRYIPIIGFQRGWRVTELPVNHRPRRHGRSKFGSARYARGLLDLLSVMFLGRYQFRPLHLFGGTGLMLMGVGVLISAYLSLLWFGGEPIGRRPLLLLGVLLIVVGFQLVTLGLIGEMLVAMRQDISGPRTTRDHVARVVS